MGIGSALSIGGEVGGAVAAVAGGIGGLISGGGSGHAIFQLRVGPFVANELHVISFRGHERISNLFSYHVTFKTSVDLRLLEPLSVGQTATLILNADGHPPRAIQGIARTLQPEGVYDASSNRYSLRLVPRLWLLTRNQTSRIFQDMTVIDIVSKILTENSLPFTLKLANKAIYQKWTYCVQYQESDYAFIKRLLAEEGLFFYFDPPSALLDELTGGVGSAIAGEVGAAAGAVSALGGAGAAIGGAINSVSGALGLTESIIIGDSANAYLALTDSEIDIDAGAALTSAVSAISSSAGNVVGGLASAVGLGGPASATLNFRDADGMRPDNEHVNKFVMRRAVKTKSVLISDFDFRRPMLDLKAQQKTAPIGLIGHMSASVGISLQHGLTGGFSESDNIVIAALGVDPAKARMYDHHGEHEVPDVTRPEAQMHLDQYRRKIYLAKGESGCRRLAPGYRFTLAEHSIDKFNNEYVVTRLESEGFVPELEEHRDKDPGYAFVTRFECVPSGIVYRQARPKRVIRQVLETAIVVGPADEEIYTDEFGRIKVQFHWDLEGKRDEHSSCWIRVAQTWAGASWGFQFIPRIGMEVLVQFMGGDQDRPMVTGCVYNATSPAPYRLPERKSQSGIRTRSTPGGGGYNELSFEDQKDLERITVHAQRDMDETVRNNHTTTVMNDQKLEVRRDQEQRIQGNRTSAVVLDQQEKIGGRVFVDIGGDEQRSIGGRRMDTIGGDVSSRVEHSFDLAVGKQHRVVVGSDAEKGAALMYVDGNYHVGTSDTITVNAEKNIILTCGQSSITLTPDQVTILSPTVVVNGAKTTTVVGKNATLLLNGDAALGAGNVEVQSKGAIMTMDSSTAEIVGTSAVKLFGSASSLVLDPNATLVGTMVKLNPGGGSGQGPSSSAPPSSQPPMTQPFTTTLLDEAGQPYAGLPYVLIVDGVKYKGTTTGSGGVSQQIPPTAETASLTLLIGDAPNQQKVKWQLALLDQLLPETTTYGAQSRLRNLGYYTGALSGTQDDATRDALTRFQENNGLPATGELDGATSSKLQSVHGS